VGYAWSVKEATGEVRTDEASLVTFDIQPSTGVTKTADSLTFTVAADYVVTARVKIEEITLEAKEVISVHPAAASRVALEVSTVTPVAGTRVEVSARLLDPFDNTAEPPGSIQLKVEPSEGVSISGTSSVMITRVGRYELVATELGTGLNAHAGLDVSAAAAVSARLELSESRILPNSAIEATFLGSDAFGNEVPLEATYTVEPSGGVQVQGETIRFNQEGIFVVTASGGGIEESAQVVVDGTAPVLMVASPERASFQEGTTVTLSGNVTDSVAGLASLKVGDQEIEVRGNDFSMELFPAPGTNILVFEAVDFNGNRSSHTRSFLWAPAWTPLDGVSKAGLEARLNPTGIEVVADLLCEMLISEDLEEDLMADNPIYTYEQQNPPLFVHFLPTFWHGLSPNHLPNVSSDDSLWSRPGDISAQKCKPIAISSETGCAV
jgi:hypothetical protein